MIQVRNVAIDEAKELYATHILTPRGTIAGVYEISPEETVICMTNTTGINAKLATLLVWYPPTMSTDYESFDDFAAALKVLSWPDADIDSLARHLN